MVKALPELQAKPLPPLHRSVGFAHAAAWVAACIGGLTGILAEVDSAQAQVATTLDQVLARMPSHMAAEVEERLFRQSAPMTVEPRALEKPAFNSQSQTASSVSGIVTVSARCAKGHAVDGRYFASAQDVVIESEELIDCDVDGCRAFQVIAKRVSTKPYDINVQVTCAK